MASHVRVRVKLLAQVPPAVTSDSRRTVAPPQASAAVGAVNDGVAVHSIVALAPALPIVGACVSTTVMVCVLVAL